MCVQVTKTANRFEISSLLEKILLKRVRWCLTFVGLYISQEVIQDYFFVDLKVNGICGVMVSVLASSAVDRAPIGSNQRL